MTDPLVANHPPRPPELSKEALFTILHRAEGASEKTAVLRDCKPLVEPMMLRGTPRSLTVEDCLVIAVWAFKTLVVHNHAYNKPPFLFSAAARKRFIETLFPPENNFRVWVGRFDVLGRFGHMTGLQLGPNALARPQLKRVSCYVLTFTVGQFMFQAPLNPSHNVRMRRA